MMRSLCRLLNISIVLLIAIFTIIFVAPQPSAFAKSIKEKVRSGETVYSILKKHGFSQKQRNAALYQAHLPDSFLISPGDIYALKKDPKSNRTELKFFNNNKPTYFVFWKSGAEQAGAEEKDANFETRVVTANGKIRGSLVQSLSSTIGDDLLAYRFMDAFLLDYNLPKILKRNADYSVTYEKYYDNGQFVRNGNILSASLEIGDKIVNRTFVKTPGGGVYVDELDIHKSRPFYSPVNHIKFASLFQPKRFHPIKKTRKAHQGIDFEAPEGTPIYAVANGIVKRMGRNRAAGNFIVIQHSDGYETFYNHLRKIAPEVTVGKFMRVGSSLGEIGCTGYCTNSHLHFAMKSKGQFIDPIKHIRSYSYKQKKTIQNYWAKLGN